MTHPDGKMGGDHNWRGGKNREYWNCGENGHGQWDCPHPWRSVQRENVAGTRGVYSGGKVGQAPARYDRLACEVSDSYVHTAEDGDEGRIDCCGSSAWSDDDGAPVGRMADGRKRKKGEVNESHAVSQYYKMIGETSWAT